MEWYNLLVSGCPIRKSADRFVFANPRSLSQLITSFIAFQSLGIPHVPLFTFFSPTGYEFTLYTYKMNYPGLINTSVFCSLIYELFSLVAIPVVKQQVSLSLLFALVLFHHVKDRFKALASIAVWYGVEPIVYTLLMMYTNAPKRASNLKIFLFSLSRLSINSLVDLAFLLSFLVENNGFEPLTPCVQGRCSSQLS